MEKLVKTINMVNEHAGMLQDLNTFEEVAEYQLKELEVFMKKYK